jgi:hypothetical protein
MISHGVVYGLLLRLYPARFRRTYGHEMEMLFADLVADQRGPGARLGTFRLWVHTLADTMLNASRERIEDTMQNQAAITRTLMFVFPIAGFAAMGTLGMYLGFAVLAVGVLVLVVRRRTLPDALVGSGRGRWWAWTLAGMALVGLSFVFGKIFSDIGGDFANETAWLLWFLLFFSGALVIAVSLVRGLAILLRRPSTPAA